MQQEWEDTVAADSPEDTVVREKFIKKPSGRAGRVDTYVETPEGYVAVVEFMASRWDSRLFGDEGIAVVWNDESVDEHKARIMAMPDDL